MRLDDLIEDLIKLRDQLRVDGTTPVRVQRMTKGNDWQLHRVERVSYDDTQVRIRVLG